MTNRTPLCRRALAAMVIASMAMLGGCNTVKGIGKDIEKVGEKTQEAAQKVSKEI